MTQRCRKQEKARAAGRVRRVLVLGALTVVVAAAGIGHGAREAQPDGMLAQLDTDRDGYVSRDEASRLEGFERVFDRAEADRDGRLDAREFEDAQELYERMRAERFLDDGIITARIRVALVRDPEVSSVDVNVETHDGAVQLSGAVDDVKQARRAVEVASGVRGVISVSSALTVKQAEAEVAAREKRQ